MVDYNSEFKVMNVFHIKSFFFQTKFILSKSTETKYGEANVYQNMLKLPNLLTTSVEISMKTYDTRNYPTESTADLLEISFLGFGKNIYSQQFLNRCLEEHVQKHM